MTSSRGWFAWAALLVACGVDDSPQDSSGSHWLKCAVDADCTPFDDRSACVAGYCENEAGERLVDEGPAEPGPDPGASAGGSSASGSNGGASGAGAPSAATSQAGSSTGEGGNDAVAGTPNLPSEACPVLPEPLGSPNVFDGDYVISNEGNLTTAAEFSEITGSLTLSPRAAADVTELYLPGLERIGSLSANLSSIVRIELPLLQAIDGDLVLERNPSLTGANFPSLSSIGGSLSVNDNPALERLSLPLLSSVGQDIAIGPAPLPNCETQALFDAVAEAQTYDGGRDDCTCDLLCDQWTATCP